ncbi:lysosomal thioesterase PPT2 [Struthio camelus]|uniref:lysosomal thioesterase PPT2 n=1 Tax=Struthio camelus TaxID=8801 RepID=UPI0036041434
MGEGSREMPPARRGGTMGRWGGALPWAFLPPFLFLLGLAAPGGSYRPVIVVHGLFDSPADFRHLLAFINETHPGTNVTVVDLFDRGESLKPLWVQVEGFRRAVTPIMANAAAGVHLLCYSQGGLICRALLSTMPDHNVQNFISLSAPQMGQYGDTSYLRWLFPRHMKSNLYRLCYTPLGQDVSICNYWNGVPSGRGGRQGCGSGGRWPGSPRTPSSSWGAAGPGGPRVLRLRRGPGAAAEARGALAQRPPPLLPCTDGASRALRLPPAQSSCQEHRRLLLPERNVEAFFVSARAPGGLQRRRVLLKLGDQRPSCEADALRAPLYANASALDDVVTPRFLCSGGTEPVVDPNACRGDSGGPIIISRGKRYFQVGVISWGVLDACRQPQAPPHARDFHVNLFEVLPWLRQQLRDEDLGFLP